MGVTVQRLRRWIVAAAVLLMAVVAGFVFYGRNRYRHIEKDLPARLGVNIQQTATGFVYTQSSQGHALFTLKASKELQLRSGHVLLHDVDITLYGPPGSGRADRIYGNDFDYDQANGVATSQGEVNIELQGMGKDPAAAGQSENAAAPPAEADGNTIHVRTSGLTFVQKSGEASTTQPVEFQLPRAAGTSVGADYNSKTGVLVLQSQVHISTSSNGRSAVVGAAHATLVRASNQAFLVNATIDYDTSQGSSDAAVVDFRRDGTAQKVDAKGHVRMKTDTGAAVGSETAQILLDDKSQPTQAVMEGGVQFASVRPDETMHGSADNGTLQFTTVRGKDGQEQSALHHGEFRQGVQFADEVTGLPKDPHGHAEKHLHAEKVDVDFGPAAPGEPVEAQRAFAEGAPVMTTTQAPSKGPQQTTRISGDHLQAMFGSGNTLEKLDGEGNTRIVQSSTDGSHDATQGDTLHATFGQQVAAVQPTRTETPFRTGESARRKAADEGPKMQTTLETAVQDGHVVLMETPAKKPGAATEPATLTAWAQHAEYHAAGELLHLTGSPRMTDSETMQLAAETIDYNRGTQDAAADGDVKATYTEQKQKPGTQAAAPSMGGSGPVHVIAERAALHHATNENFFYGTVHDPARMWQDANSLLAPVIEVDRNKNVLKAWGEDAGATPVVEANFTSAMGAQHQQSVVRVHSQTLVYSDKTRQGDFHGAVTAEQGNGTVHSDDALVYLKPAQPAGKTSATAGPQNATAARQSSQVDHMVATGRVIFTEPGRKGDGEKLVYTADEGKYVLTGTADAPPKMWDRSRGTTTGEALIFNGQNDSVEVSGGKSGAVTVTRSPK